MAVVMSTEDPTSRSCAIAHLLGLRVHEQTQRHQHIRPRLLAYYSPLE